MHTYMALYDREEAEATQAKLQALGINDADGANVFGKDSSGFGGKGAGPSAEDRRFYDEAIKRGGYVLTVNVDDEHHDQVHRILEGSDAVDVEERHREYEQKGWLGAATGAVAGGAAAATKPTAHETGAERVEGEQAIPIVEEELRVGKRAVERGGVRVRAYTVETPVQEQVTLREERVGIERRAVSQPVGAADFQDRTVEVSATAEEAVIAKQAVVKEELVVRKDVDERTETINDSVRHTEVDVERTGGQDPRLTEQPRR